MMGMIKIVKAFAASAAFAGTLAMASLAEAQSFPDRPVTLVVPFGPGGSNDNYGRILAEKLSKLWGQTVIVDNRPGAGSAIGSAHVAQSKPDGYTLLFVSTSYGATAAMQTQLPYDPLTALKPVAMAYDADLYMLTGKRTPMKTVAEVQQAGKAQTLFTGSPGVGSITHLAGLTIDDTLGTKTEYVQHTSGANVMADIGGGRVDLYYGVVFEALAGPTTPVAILSPNRSPALPDVPTIAEAGYPDAEVRLWFGVFAPAGVPADVAAKINADITTVTKAADMAEFMKTQGLRSSELKPDEFAEVVAADIKRFTALAEKHGIRK